MRQLFAFLPESRTHAVRWFRMTRGEGENDAFLVIQQGQEGPRGGRSRIDVESYDVQEVPSDPDNPFVGRVFLLAKDNDAEPDVYEVWVPGRGRYARCSCIGNRLQFTCKHADTFRAVCLTYGWYPHDWTNEDATDPDELAGLNEQGHAGKGRTLFD